MPTLHKQLCETAQYIVCHMAMVIYSILLMFNGFQIRFFLQRDLSNKIKEFYERTKSIWILLKSIFINYLRLLCCNGMRQNKLNAYNVGYLCPFHVLMNYKLHFPKRNPKLGQIARSEQQVKLADIPRGWHPSSFAKYFAIRLGFLLGISFWEAYQRFWHLKAHRIFDVILMERLGKLTHNIDPPHNIDLPFSPSVSQNYVDFFGRHVQFCIFWEEVWFFGVILMVNDCTPNVQTRV